MVFDWGDDAVWRSNSQTRGNKRVRIKSHSGIKSIRLGNKISQTQLSSLSDWGIKSVRPGNKVRLI